jgi:hypothetical protein
VHSAPFKHPLKQSAFTHMKINELKQHEEGILNLFENELQRKKFTTQHNVTEKENGDYVRLK